MHISLSRAHYPPVAIHSPPAIYTTTAARYYLLLLLASFCAAADNRSREVRISGEGVRRGKKGLPLVSSRRPRATRHSLDRRCRRRGAPRPALFFSRFFFFFFSHGLVPERARVRDLPCLSLSTVVQELLGGLTEGAAGDVEGLKVLYRRNFGAHYTLSLSLFSTEFTPRAD